MTRRMEKRAITTSAEFKAARIALGLSVSQCADLCRVYVRTIRRWETGAGHGDGRNPHPSACRLMEIEMERAGVE